VTVNLTAGTHSLSVRASKDGSTALPGADITLDRFDLYDVSASEQAAYPAIDARLAGGATLACDWGATAGDASLSGAGSATFFAATAETGYYDVTAQLRTTGATAVSLSVNGRAVQFPAITRSGPWNATVRVFLPQGVNELKVTAPGAALAGITTLRAAAQKAADANLANVFRSEAEALPLSGAARVQTDAAGSNGFADAAGTVHDVGYLGNGAGNTVGIPRPSGFGAGDYQLVLGASNADKAGAINYNPQVISRFLDITETGGSAARAAFRNDYAWNSYWDKTIPLHLTTASGTLVLGNSTAYGPNLDTVTLAKFVAGVPTITRSAG
jgi:hypothetical protein